MSTKILTIDDSKTIRLIVAKAFKAYDCTILEAPNGIVGLAVAGREKPDIILLDYTMPVMDGFEVLARLRSDPELKATAVIMLTAEAGRETVIKIAKLGVRDYLIKPFKEELLIERVGRVVPLRPRTEEVARVKRFDDPIHLLIVDDKPAIVEQIRTAVADTPWKINSADQPGQALDDCMKQGPDAVLVSLSLPKDGAYMLFQNLRGLATTSSIPVIGLSVKTATAEQLRAQQAGFAGIVLKPIDPKELKTKLSRTLKLETSYKYFQQHDGFLVLRMPEEVNEAFVHEVMLRLKDQLAETVNAGGDKLIIDFGILQRATLPVVQLVLAVVQACAELSLKCAIASPDNLRAECQAYEESQAWHFAKSIEEASALLNDSNRQPVAS
jgi:two-component system cell cycle response regulator